MGDIDDIELIDRIKSGDISAFEILVRNYEKRILGFLRRYIYDEKDREDLTQEIFILLYKNIGKIESEKPISAYLFTIARSKAISFLRSRKSNLPIETADEISSDVDIYSSIFLKEQADEIKSVISDLPEKYRSVIWKYYFEDLSYDEISQNLEIPVNTVRTVLRRAKDKLRKVVYEK